MSHRLIDHNADLKRLREKGYNVSIEGGAHLIVRDIVYVNDKREVRDDGVLVTALELSGEQTIQPTDHTMRFAGDCPCNAQGQSLYAIRPNRAEFQVHPKLHTQYHFSNKPLRGYLDYFEKVNTYATVLAQYAVEIDPDAPSPLTGRVVEPEEGTSPFRYLDTASAKAEINMITQKLAVERIAILEPIREVRIQDEGVAVRRLSMMRIMASRMKATTLAV